MRNPTSSSPPVVTGPGNEYRREHWPVSWQTCGTFTACSAAFSILVATAFEPKFGLGLVAGLLCVLFMRGES